MRTMVHGLLSRSGRPLDGYSTANLGVWSLYRERSAYTGYAVRVSTSGGSTLDIGFNADGSFDMSAYTAFGSGSERVIKWYDQSGNGFDLSNSYSATLCPIIRTSSYNSKPCVYFSQGYLRNAAFTNWNGLTNCTFLIASKPITIGNNAPSIWGGSASRQMYQAVGSASEQIQLGASNANRVKFTNRDESGRLDRYVFNGGGSGSAERGRYYRNGSEVTASGFTGTMPATLPDETGISINGHQDYPTIYLDQEWFSVYYFGSAVNVTSIESALRSRLFNFTDSIIIYEGDSITYNSSNGGPTDASAWPLQVTSALQTYTGKTWTGYNVAAGGATYANQINTDQQQQVLDKYDSFKARNILVLWAGTNDIFVAGGGAASVTQLLSDTVAYITTAKNKGFTVFVCTMLPRSGFGPPPASFETDRLSFNAQLPAAVSGLATVIDTGMISQLQNVNSSTYYVDQVHPTAAGNVLIKNLVSASIEAVLG